MSALSKQRLEAFTDGVVAIIITLMVLEIKRPADNNFAEVIPSIISYALSALVIGIMWINHHNMFHLVQQSSNKLMWLNIHLLFWMSLIPLPTGAIGQNYNSVFAVQCYAVVLTGNSLSYTLLNREASKLMKDIITINAKRKINRVNYISLAIYIASFFTSYLSVYISYLLFTVVPIIYFNGKLYNKK